MKKLLNLNIFYDPNYWLKHRKLFSSSLSQSSLLNNYYLKSYKNNYPINENFIKSGPQKLVNNILKSYLGNKNVVFNQSKFNNYYFINFDQDNLELVKNLLKNKSNKLIIGPLYTVDNFKNLAKLTTEHENLKIAVASESSMETMKNIAKDLVSSEKFLLLPVGIQSTKEIYLFAEKKKRINNQCLIYFKGRKKTELEYVKAKLKAKNISFEIYEYGKYKNRQLIKVAKKSKYGIVLGRTESQGIAINEIMATNLPLLILNSSINNYEGKSFHGTTVPYWDKSCGEIVNDLNSFDDIFEHFIENVDSNIYNSSEYIAENLSFESMHRQLDQAFKSF